MAEKTLRERCIEAGAEAIANDRAEGAVTLAHLDDAKVAFDAVLGVLTEHADEWIGDVGAMEWETWTERAIVLGLLAVLGGDE